LEIKLREEFQIGIFRLLRHLRGHYNQKEISLKLGLKESSYHKWEAGYKDIYLSDMDRICKFKKISLIEIITSNLVIKDEISLDSSLLIKLNNTYQIDENRFFKETGISKSKWWRLTSKVSDVKLIDFLVTFEFFTNKAKVIFNDLGLISDKENSFYDFLQRENAIDFCSVIYLEDIKKEVGFKQKVKKISTKMGVEESQIIKMISYLEENDIMYKKEDDNLDFSEFINHLPQTQRELSLKLFNKTYQNIMSGLQVEGVGKFSFRNVVVSAEAREELNILNSKFNNDVYTIIKKDFNKKKEFLYSYVLSSLFK
jgi:transcriptional regulator with XRE-family HTH domain